MRVEQMLVSGVGSAEHARTICDTLGRLPGVQRVQVQTATSTVQVVHTGELQVNVLLQALKRLGYTGVSVLV